MFLFDTTTWLLFGAAAYFSYARGQETRYLARGLGYYMGRAVGFAMHVRARFLTNAPLWDLHQEIAQSILQINSVR